MEIKLRNSLRNSKIIKNDELIENNNYQEIDDNNNIVIRGNTINNTKHIIERDILPPDSVVLDRNAIDRINQSELESRNKLNNEINKLRDQIQYQQQALFSQINSLKNEAEKANDQREETLKEIEKLKEEIAKHSKDNQDIKGRFLHEIVIHDDENKETEVCTQTEPPKEEDPLELNKLYKKNVDRINYLDEIERLNRLRPAPASEYFLERKIFEPPPPFVDDYI